MRAVLAKLAHLFVVLTAVTMLTFVMLDVVPADIAAEVAGHGATAEDVAAVRERLGLNDPAPVRYATWVGNLVRGDLGRSLASGEPVAAVIRSHLPVTLELLALAQLFALILAVPTAIAAAWREGGIFDRAAAGFAFGSLALPPFAAAFILILVFSLKLRWLPATGYTPFADGLGNNLRGFLLPAFSIALAEWVPLMRALRGDLAATLREDFILVARAKGLPPWKVLLRHALRPSCFTTITIFGLQVGHLIGGAVIVEMLFALPGIGRLLYTGIVAQDFPVVQGCVVVIVTAFVAVNFLVDFSYALLDPRARSGGRNG